CCPCVRAVGRLGSTLERRATVRGGALCAAVPSTEVCRPTRASSPQGFRIYFATTSDDFCLPTTLPKYVGADEGKRRESDGDGEEDAARPEAEFEGEHIGERNLPEPEYEEIDDRRRPRVPGAVERLRDDHAVGVEEKSARDDPQSLRTVAVHFGAGGGLREDTDDLVGEDNKE